MEKMIVEVSGVKMEVDMRTAKRIDTLQIGSRVKVLRKSAYASDYRVMPGVIVGFEPFESLPSIVVCYLDISWSEAKLEFFTFNAKSTDIEIVAALDHDELEVSRSDVFARIDKEIAKKQEEIAELERRREFFDRNFAAYFATHADAA